MVTFPRSLFSSSSLRMASCRWRGIILSSCCPARRCQPTPGSPPSGIPTPPPGTPAPLGAHSLRVITLAQQFVHSAHWELQARARRPGFGLCPHFAALLSATRHVCLSPKLQRERKNPAIRFLVQECNVPHRTASTNTLLTLGSALPHWAQQLPWLRDQ